MDKVRRKEQGHQAKSGNRLRQIHCEKPAIARETRALGCRKTNSLCGTSCYVAFFIVIHEKKHCFSIRTLGSQIKKAEAISENQVHEGTRILLRASWRGTRPFVRHRPSCNSSDHAPRSALTPLLPGSSEMRSRKK